MKPPVKDADDARRAGGAAKVIAMRNGAKKIDLPAKPLYSEDLEKAVLGIALKDAGDKAQQLVAAGAELLYLPQSRILFGHIADAVGAGDKPDAVLIADRITREEAGVPPYFVSECADLSYQALQFEAYVADLRDLASRRKLRTLINTAGDRIIDGADASTLMAEMQAGLADIGNDCGREWEAELDALRFDPAAHPPEERCIYALAEHVIATPGNIIAVSAQAKQGKTAFMGAVIAATMSPQGDTLGVTSNNEQGGAVLLFDTEQSERHFHDCITRALTRAGRPAPAYLRAYRVKSKTIAERRRFLVAELKRASKACGSIHSVILDGVGDFVNDPNDPAEAFAFIQELGELADQYSTVIFCVLHENPNSEAGKTRGHLGSHLERKAESNLRLQKDGEGITVVFSDKSRGAHIPKEAGPRFQWSDEDKMHVTCASAGKQRESAKMADHRMLADQVFQFVPAAGLAWKDVISALMDAADLKHEGARKRLACMLEAGAIRHTGDRYQRGHF